MINYDLEDIRVQKSSSSNSLLRAALNWFRDRPNLLIFLLTLLLLFLHLLIVPYPDTLLYDEGHYVPEARSIIDDGELTHPEHPSLGKLFIASGILVFGDNPWGWRIPAVLFGVASVVLFYFICRKLAGRLAALLAFILLAFECLTFTISGVGMLDVFSLTFLLLAFLFYLQDRYVFSGVSLALSGLCKMTGLLGLLVILGHWFIRKRRRSPRNIGFFLVSAFVGFMLLMPLFDFAGTREWLNPIDRIWYMLVSHQGLTFEDIPLNSAAGQSYPWAWIFNPIYTRADTTWFFWISPIVWVLIIPSIGYMVYEFARKKADVALFAMLWFGSIYLVWIPLVLATDRLTYYFYFYPAVGVVCLAIGFAMKRLWEIASKKPYTPNRGLLKVAVIGFLIVNILIFLVCGPLLPALRSYLSF